MVLAVLLAAGCASTHHPAPVSDRTRAPSQAQGKPAATIVREPDTRPDFYTVKRGDTVVLASGVIGKVVRVEDVEVGVEISTGVTIKVVKLMIHEVRIKGSPAPANDAKS